MELALVLLAMGLLLNVFHKCDAVLEVVPLDTEVMVNDSTYMNCSTSLEAHKIHWRHGNNYVYAATRILEPYNGRFSVEINSSTGTNNLVIRSVQPSDTGHYECLEDEGHAGERRSAQLIVLDDIPVCKSNMHSSGVIGPNTCDIEPDEIKLSCTITYHGIILPILQWKASGADKSIRDGVYNLTPNKNDVTYTLTMKSTIDLNGYSFTCQTTRSSKKNYSCSSDAIKILYIFSSRVTINMTLSDKASCFANTSQSCSYTWKRFNGYDWMDVSNDQILKPKEVGRHRCEATCSMRNKSCILEPVYAEVYSISDTNEKNLLALLVLFVLAVGLVGLFVAIYLRKKKRRNEERRQKEERRQIERELELKEREPEQQSLIESEREEREQEQQRLIDILPIKYKEGPVLVQTIRTKATEEKKLVAGLTILDKELFVVGEESSAVEVYDSMKFSFIRQWNLEELHCPWDIGSCDRNKCLYIFDYRSVLDQLSEIFRVEPNGKLIKKWSTGCEGRCRLSVTEDSNVILAAFGSNRLREYSPDGHLNLEIDLLSTANIHRPWHAIKLTNSHFLVSYGDYGDDKRGVCTVDAEGKLVKEHGRKCESTIEQMNHPFYLAVDRDGLVMVADSGNGRVLLFDLELNLKGVLLSKKVINEFRCPTRIILDETNDRLFVADNEWDASKTAYKNGQILIIAFRQIRKIQCFNLK